MNVAWPSQISSRSAEDEIWKDLLPIVASCSRTEPCRLPGNTTITLIYTKTIILTQVVVHVHTVVWFILDPSDSQFPGTVGVFSNWFRSAFLPLAVKLCRLCGSVGGAITHTCRPHSEMYLLIQCSSSSSSTLEFPADFKRVRSDLQRNATCKQLCCDLLHTYCCSWWKVWWKARVDTTKWKQIGFITCNLVLLALTSGVSFPESKSCTLY